AIPVRILLEIFVLSLDIAANETNRPQFVLADASVENFLPASGDVERPLPVVADDRNRKRPVLLADEDDVAAVGLSFHRMLRLHLRRDLLERVLVRHRVA